MDVINLQEFWFQTGLLNLKSYTKYSFKIPTFKNFMPDFLLSKLNVWTLRRIFVKCYCLCYMFHPREKK